MRRSQQFIARLFAWLLVACLSLQNLPTGACECTKPASEGIKNQESCCADTLGFADEVCCCGVRKDLASSETSSNPGTSQSAFVQVKLTSCQCGFLCSCGKLTQLTPAIQHPAASSLLDSTSAIHETLAKAYVFSASGSLTSNALPRSVRPVSSRSSSLCIQHSRLNI